MPARAESARLTDAYRDRLLGLRQASTRIARVSFARIAQDDLDASYAAWQLTATAALAAAKAQGALLTGRYLAAFMASETLSPVAPLAVDTEQVSQQDRAGRPLTLALAAPLLTVKMRLAQGADYPTALQAGAARMTRTVAGEAMAAPRDTLSELMQQQDQIVGWHRVASSSACGACLAAATGAIRADDEVPEAHDSCRCVAEPVVRGARETVRRPTGTELFAARSAAEQARLFAGRGGEEKAALIRDGRVPLEALLTRSPRVTQADSITETPLADLQRLAR